MSERSMNNTNTADARAAASDIKVVGNPDAWKLVCKASSQAQGWMRSTKAMDVPGGCVLQVSTQVGGAVAEAVTFIPGAKAADMGG